MDVELNYEQLIYNLNNVQIFLTFLISEIVEQI